ILELLEKAKCKAQNSSNLREEADICNQLGELLSRNGDYEAAIEEHQQELSLSEVLNDVIGRAVANRKIGECYAELGNIETALKHQRLHLDLARSVRDHIEEQRALATIGRTYLFCFESDQSRKSLEQAEDAFRKSLAIVDDLKGTVPEREIHEMKARLFLNLGLVCDHQGEPECCSEFIRRSVFIADGLLEDLYRANYNLGNIFFRNGQHSNSVRCLEQAKECARKMKNKFSESECFHCIGKVQLSLGDFVAARRSLKKALLLGSQQQQDKQTVKNMFIYADRGCKLEEELGENPARKLSSHEAIGLSEQLGDLYCKVGCFHKALEAYQAQLKGAEALAKPARELAVIHVSLAATFTDLRRHGEAVQHYKQELALRGGSPAEECSTWLNIAAAQEESGGAPEDQDSSYSAALHCAKKCGQARLQRVLRLWLAAQRRKCSSDANDTEAKLLELCASENWSPDGSDGEEEAEEEMDNSEPLDDSDVVLSDSDDDLEGYDKTVSGRRKAGRWNKRNEKGETSLHRACIDGNLKQVQYLVEQGHPVNPRDYCGWTPLHEACNHGHYDIVAVLLDRGANINDQGGNLCEGVTPLHDALTCGNFPVARLLVERGASINLRNAKGETAMDTLRRWQRTYKNELDHEAKQECAATEQLLKKALAGVISGRIQYNNCAVGSPILSAMSLQYNLQYNMGYEETLSTLCISVNQHLFCFQDKTSSSDDSDSDSPVSPLHPVRQRLSVPAVQCQKVPTPNEGADSLTNPGRQSGHDPPAPFVFAQDEYHTAIRGLGSARTLLQGCSTQPHFPTLSRLSSSSKSALIPEEDYRDDDWLENDLMESQPKKKRFRVEQNGASGDNTISPSARAPNSQMSHRSENPAGTSHRRAHINNSFTLAMTATFLNNFHFAFIQPLIQGPALSTPMSLPPPIRMRVRVQDDIFLIPVPQSEAKSCTVSWLCDQAAQRYYQKCGLLPRLSLQKDGAQLSPHDLLLDILHTNEEVLAEVSSWDLPPLQERYKKACISLAVGEQPTHILNPLGDSISESLSSLLSACPLLAELSLRGCELTSRFLQQHRLLLASALTGTGHLKSVCLSHNALGSTGFELVLKTLPLHTLTHLDLSAVRRGTTDYPALKHLTILLSQDNSSLTHLNLAANGLTDSSASTLARCLAVCPSLVNLDLSGNPSITSVGFHSILCALREGHRPLTLLNLQGCQVSGPLDSEDLDALSELVQDLRLCSQGLNKLDRHALEQSWTSRHPHGYFVDRKAACFLSTAAAASS
uniref:Tonsoku-like protein n=1 Tax=Hippocampus comes TaxID=109280 RepID=A0A3Q2ZER5_HIPCM